MTATIDSKKAWTALSADPEFAAGVPASAQPHFKELVESLPERLGDLSGEPLTLASLARAKIAVLKATVETGFLKKMAASMGQPGMDAMMEAGIDLMLATFEEIAGNADGWLGEQEIDEATFMSHPKGGRLNGPAMRAYRAGTLTVGGLLELQPLAIIQNAD